MNYNEHLKEIHSYETCDSLYQILENFDKVNRE
jgi:hypothetical protein